DPHSRSHHPEHLFSNRIEQRIGHSVQRLHDWIPGIGIDPAQQRPNDDDPDVGLEQHVKHEGHGRKKVAGDEHYCLPSSSERLVAASTAAMSAARTPPTSIAWSPSMVVPPGDVTLSFNCAGCSPVSICNLAAPKTVCAAKLIAAHRDTRTLSAPAPCPSTLSKP